MSGWPEEDPIELDHPLVPEPIRKEVLELYSEGDNLHRVVTEEAVEWWLTDQQGDLIEVFWEENHSHSGLNSFFQYVKSKVFSL